MKLMKAVILVVALFIILSLATQVRSQSRADLKSIIDNTIVQAKEASINSSSVQWDSISTLMHEVAIGAKSVADLKRSLEVMANVLHDRQLLLFNSTNNTIITRVDPQLLPSNANSDLATFHFTMLDNNICYLRLANIPAGTSVQNQVAEIRQAIDSLSKGNSSQWIVDLRVASGDDASTLLAAVAPLLDEGLVATTIDNHKSIKNMYTVHNGNLYVDQIAVTKFPLWTKDLRKNKIAVLTSHQTRGAAEVLTLGLKGRKHTKIFGEATAGHNFKLADVQITPGVTMRLAHLRYVDRKGNEYQERIYPDVKIEVPFGNNLGNDPFIAQATEWLTEVQESAIALGMN